MTAATITVYSHGIRVDTQRSRVIQAMSDYCTLKLAERKLMRPYRGARPRPVIHRIFAGASRDRRQFRFHRNCLEDLLAHLDGSGVPRSQIECHYRAPPQAASLTLEMGDHIELWPDQVPVVDFLANPDQTNKVCEQDTGSGKTLCSLVAMHRLGKRTLIQLRGGFIYRWLEELETHFHYAKGDVMVVRGHGALMSLINQARTGELRASVIIITWGTLYKLLSAYEKDPYHNEYGISPEELYELCQIGLRINDEVHLDYHFNFRSDIYANVQSSIQLSATLRTDDSFRRQMYEISLPRSDWYKGGKSDAYIGVYSVRYRARRPNKIRTQQMGDTRYSHQAFEKSVMRNRKMIKNYLALIRRCVQYYYISDWEGGQRAIIFCSLIKLCEKIVADLARSHPELAVRVYHASTPESTLAEADIIVTTVESCGVAVDIKDLKLALLTRAIAKKEMNEQIMGRLRRSKRWPNMTPRFCFFTCTSIPKHLDYEEKKKEDLAHKSLYFRYDDAEIDL